MVVAVQGAPSTVEFTPVQFTSSELQTDCPTNHNIIISILFRNWIEFGHGICSLRISDFTYQRTTRGGKPRKLMELKSQKQKLLGEDQSGAELSKCSG
jgi:hypothetical protein